MALTVDLTIPHANACGVTVAEDADPATVSFAADPHGGPECLWFCFRLTPRGRPSASQVRLVLQHATNMLGGGEPQHMRPVVRHAGTDWERLGAPTVQALPDGRSEVAWTVRLPATWMDVAYCYPYGPAELKSLLRDCKGYWRADAIGVSQRGRPLIRLSNGWGDRQAGGAAERRPGVYAIARQHSGETPGSWVLDGFLRRMAELGSAAPLVWAVPLAHTDGVEKGDYGKDGFPHDLNRAWGRPPMRHEVLVYQADVARWVAACRPALALDLHAPGACETEGVYCYVPEAKRAFEQHRTLKGWVTAMQRALRPEFAARPFGRVADYASRWETPTFTAHCWAEHGVPALSIETPYAVIGSRVLTREDYRGIGARLAAPVAERLPGTRPKVPRRGASKAEGDPDNGGRA